MNFWKIPKFRETINNFVNNCNGLRINNECYGRYGNRTTVEGWITNSTTSIGWYTFFIYYYDTEYKVNNGNSWETFKHLEKMFDYIINEAKNNGVNCSYLYPLENNINYPLIYNCPICKTNQEVKNEQLLIVGIDIPCKICYEENVSILCKNCMSLHICVYCAVKCNN